MSNRDSIPSDAVQIDGLMNRADREMILWLLLAAGVIAAFQISPQSPLAWALYLAMALGILRFAFGERAGLKEAVTLRVTNAGLELLRKDGRRRHVGAWRLFDSATIQQIPSRDPFHGLGRWRLTVNNACIPSIGSFLHTTASEQIVFHFPILITFEAPGTTADRLMEQLQARIKFAQQRPSKKPVRHEAFDPAALLKLHECMACSYPLRGLPANGACPECGWAFNDQMFVAEGQASDGGSRFGCVIGAAAIFVLAGLVLQSPLIIMVFMLMLALAGAFYVISKSQRVTPFRNRVLVTGTGVEVWRGNSFIAAQRWPDICELRSAWTQVGRYRIAAWNQPKQNVRYGSFFERWVSDPPGGLIFDVFLAGNREAADVVRGEIERRWSATRRAHPPTQALPFLQRRERLTKVNSYQPW